MKKLLLASLCFLMLCVTQVYAQNRTVTGTVTAKEDGLPIPGVTVKVKGTSVGTQTNSSGKFTLSVAPNATLQFSFVGYLNQEIPTGTKTAVNAVLEQNAKSLGEVIVTTSLGIKHSQKELGYSTSQVTAKDLTQTNVINVANGLTAKVAGLAIYTLDNGVDPNTTINLRGNRSLLGNNSALIVLDGIPVPGATISSINPNDIADITILKGASSAALYGSQASNGAILISTKRGTSDGKPIITYGNSFQVENVSFYPKLQKSFGQYGGEGNYTDPNTGFSLYVPYENQLYGPIFDGSTVPLGAPLDSANGRILTTKYSALAKDPVHQFFKTGITEQNDISFQQGDAKNSFFVSAQNAYRTTIVPGDKNIRNSFSVRGHRTYGIFSADFSVGYTRTDVSTYVHNNNYLGIPGSFVTNAGANDLYSSILQLPANLNIKQFSDSNSDIGNVNNFYDAYAINPYWILQHTRDKYNRDVLLSQIKLKLDPTDWLSISYQLASNYGTYNERLTKDEADFTAYAANDYYSAGNVPSGFKATLKQPGTVYDIYNYGDGTVNGRNRVEGDAVIDLHHTFFKDFKTSLVLGNVIYQNYQKGLYSGSNQLLISGLFNQNYIGGLVNSNEYESRIRQIAYFGEASISYKGWLTASGTFRNEQDSRLSKAERSFNYPSVNVAFVPTDAIPALKDNKILSYLKLTGSVSRVGNIDVGPYSIYNTYNLAGGFPYGSLGGLNVNGTNYSPTLKPELTTEKEFGAEAQLFDGRIALNYTYYDQHIKNQTVTINTSITTGFAGSLLNIGETRSYGQEFQITGDILTQAKNKFGFQIGANVAKNESTVISLLPGVSQLSLGNSQYAVVGQPFPLLRGTDFVRDPQGRVVVSPTSGYPSTNSSALTTFGRTTPEYTLGLNTKLDYKFISLRAVAEYRGGDVIYNAIGSTLSFAGSSYLSGSAGRERFIYPNSSIETSPGVFTPNTSVSVLNGNYGFWQSSQYTATQSTFVTSGAFWKLREVDLAFNLSQLITQKKFIKGVTLAITGRNLFIWLPKSNQYTDPEFSNAGANSNTRGVNDANELPGTRVFGADLKLTF